MSYPPPSPSTTPQLQHSHGSWLSRLLELDAELHSDLISRALDVLAHSATPQGEVRRILDIGAGTGTGTVALARRFPRAQVVAVDLNEEFLRQARERAGSAGLASQASTLRADVSHPDAPLGRAELVWASAALHEVGDAPATFRNLFAALTPGGLLAVLEMDQPPQVLPASHAELERRLIRTSRETAAADHPDWSEVLSETGFVSVEVQSLRSDQHVPARGAAAEYAALELRRVGHSALATLPESDRTTLMALAGDGPDNVRSLSELWIRGSRTLWTARRPQDIPVHGNVTTDGAEGVRDV